MTHGQGAARPPKAVSALFLERRARDVRSPPRARALGAQQLPSKGDSQRQQRPAPAGPSTGSSERGSAPRDTLKPI